MISHDMEFNALVIINVEVLGLSSSKELVVM
jgi:hypothetical protein